jgi:hypothetical protein
LMFRSMPAISTMSEGVGMSAMVRGAMRQSLPCFGRRGKRVGDTI